MEWNEVCRFKREVWNGTQHKTTLDCFVNPYFNKDIITKIWFIKELRVILPKSSTAHVSLEIGGQRRFACRFPTIAKELVYAFPNAMREEESTISIDILTGHCFGLPICGTFYHCKSIYVDPPQPFHLEIVGWVPKRMWWRTLFGMFQDKKYVHIALHTSKDFDRQGGPLHEWSEWDHIIRIYRHYLYFFKITEGDITNIDKIIWNNTTYTIQDCYHIQIHGFVFPSTNSGKVHIKVVYHDHTKPIHVIITSLTNDGCRIVEGLYGASISIT